MICINIYYYLLLSIFFNRKPVTKSISFDDLLKIVEQDEIYPKLGQLVNAIQSTILGVTECDNIQYKMQNWNSIYLYQMQHNGKLPQIPCSQSISYLFMRRPHPMYYDYSGGTEASILCLLKKLRGLRLLYLERKHKNIPNPNIQKIRQSEGHLGASRTVRKPYTHSQLSSISYSGYEDGNYSNTPTQTTRNAISPQCQSNRTLNKADTTSRNSDTSACDSNSTFISRYKQSNISKCKLSISSGKASTKTKNNQVTPTNDELPRIPSTNSLAYCRSSGTMDDC